MDKSKIRANFEYEFRYGANAPETGHKITTVIGEGLTSHICRRVSL